MGFRIKLNTVVCAINANDDMNDLALRLRPDRWKVFKVLPVEGQNDGVSHTGALRASSGRLDKQYESCCTCVLAEHARVPELPNSSTMISASVRRLRVQT